MKKGFLASILLFFILCLSYGVSAQSLPNNPFFGGQCFERDYNYPCGDLYAKQIFELNPIACTPLTEVAYCASYDFYIQDPTQKATSPRPAAVNYQWYYNTTAVGINSPQYTSPILNFNDSVWVVMSGRCNLTKKVYARKRNNSSITTNSEQLWYCASQTVDMSSFIRMIYYVDPFINLYAYMDQWQKDWHYAWKLNNTAVGTDNSRYTTPLIKYNDQLAVTVTGPRICPTTFNFPPIMPNFDIRLPDNKTPNEMLAVMSDVPLIEPPLSLHWMVDGRQATNPGIGGAVGDGNVRYTDLRFGATANLAHGTNIQIEIRGVEQCAPPGTTKIQSSNTYTFTRPGDGFNDITAISIKRFKTPTDSLITNGVINLADTTVRFDININDGYGNAPVVDKISMNTRIKYYPVWTKVGFPTSTDLLKDKPILQTHIATNGQVKIWKITINLNSGPTPGTTPSAPPGTGSGN
jgi:hypothetical protein